jgi:predicted  nucleic acid-binding Zn-ribbon protein
LEEEKSRTLPLLSEKIRKRYERILKVKKDSGVANLIGDVCQGCFSRVPPQHAHEVRRNDTILTCEACGRILIYFETDQG